MKLSKEKRDQLILVVLITVGGIAGLWFGLINFQKARLKRLDEMKEEVSKKLAMVERLNKNADQIENDLATSGKALAELEENMASGDVYLWMVNNIRRFKLPYKVDVPQFSQPSLKDMDLLPKFPYKQATLTVAGTAYFHDFGKFLADFENQFPHFRVVNLDLEPTPPAMGGDKEKLSFKMDIITLIKPGAS
jgi:hypothetical protein